jgi:hypothetical protein
MLGNVSGFQRKLSYRTHGICCKNYMLTLINIIEGSLKQTDIKRVKHAGYGIRTRELLRDRILSPAPLASLANPALI